MRKILGLALALLSLQACTEENKEFASISGKIANTDAKTIVFTNGLYNKEISLNADGSFSDTIQLKNPDYFNIALNNTNVGFAYIANGFDLSLSADNNSFFESLQFEGTGSENSNFLLAQNKYGSSIGDPRNLFALDKEVFTEKLKEIRSNFDNIQKQFKGLDTDFIAENTKQNTDFFNYLENNYESQHAKAKEAAKAMEAIAKGKPSPKFKNYINYKGGKTSLDHLKGSYVYIDLWATWCNPCIAEIPALKSLEKEFHNKNIKFVSISIDDKRTAGSWENAQNKWRAMVKDKSLSGIQLFADQDLDFLQAYQVNGIPRFILIDPKGNIVDANAPRPSNPNLKNMFKKLGL
ncbi:hypothetical protein GCM10011416_00640 [Polaribacter pacificus]|uniref:Thioredoxin domain-containing protein n=1 Tax=Polaribacter pacificus TaxID=1775173 RepID=A0A917MAM8_9FLAO|nr:TlpA disulfide reductase family protein [Polaribacter pacificus]GGG88256.1 hypothetical protein GCM10011416_00640 [Polaribacter pacificus]